ncbi:MAG: hypothetical protein U0X20_17685 [Caldilineaceae bacterium]
MIKLEADTDGFVDLYHFAEKVKVKTTAIRQVAAAQTVRQAGRCGRSTNPT